jgi:hypothetical protein
MADKKSMDDAMKRLREIARSVFDNSVEKSHLAPKVARAIAKSPDLTRAAVFHAARYLLMDVMHSIRDEITRAVPPRAVGDGGMHADDVAEITRKRPKYSAWPLHSGTTLWVATREEIMVQIEFHEKMASGNETKARMLRAVCAHLEPGQRVDEALTEEQLQAICKEQEAAQ